MYSRKRLIIIGMCWLAVGFVFVGVPDTALVNADSRGCNEPPCMFPAEPNVGGILIGTDFLTGQDLTSFKIEKDAPTAPNRESDGAEVVGVGLNDVWLNQFFVYKSWRFSEKTAGGGSSTRSDAYVWISSSGGARLTGTDQCGYGLGVAPIGKYTCDLFVEAGEISIDKFEIDIPMNVDVIDHTITVEGYLHNYWVVNPEEDMGCSIIDTVKEIISPPIEGLETNKICLGLLESSTYSSLQVALENVPLIENVGDPEVKVEDVMFRSHSVKAARSPVTRTNKKLVLNDAYLEMRYGKGDDRAVVPTGWRSQEWASPVDEQGEGFYQDGGVAEGDRIGSPDFSDPPGYEGYDPTLHAGIGNPFTCQGNRGIGYPNCNSPRMTPPWELNESYVNIHRPQIFE